MCLLSIDSLVYLPIADVTVITFLIPPVTLWAGSIFLGDRFTLRELIAVAASFIGIVIVARPLSILQPVEFMCGDLHDEHHPGQVSKPLQRFWAIAIGMIGVFGGACAYTVIRHIGQRVHPLVSVNYYAVISTIVSLIALLCVPSVPFQMPSGAREWLLLLAMGVSGFGLALGLTAGLQQEKSNAATLMIYTEIVFSLILDFLIWGNVPDVYSISGGLIVLASSIFAALPRRSDHEVIDSDEERLTVWSSERLLDEDMLISSTSSYFTFEDPPLSDDDTLCGDETAPLTGLKTPTSAVKMLFNENEKI
jgi:drug/metabolite transporter (DMT)-like permease